MKHLAKSTIVIICFILTFGAVVASPIRSAWIDPSSSDRLIVEFEKAVLVSNAEGFRLVGGAARIEKLLSGSRTQQLIFQLTDYVLPDDQFSLLYWAGLGDATIDNQIVSDIEDVKVNNSVGRYAGRGTLYYVSSSDGNDTNKGLSDTAPLYSISRAQAIAEPGDFILLKRGNIWNTRVIVTKSGQADQYITYASYGKGAKPIIYSKLSGIDKIRGHKVTMATFAIRGADYIQIDNIHVKTDGKGTNRTKDDGIQIGDGSKYTVVSNCVAEGIQSHGYYGIRVTVDGLPNTTRPEVVNCEVFNYYANIGTQIWPYDGKHGIEEGGKIENCISRDPIKPNDIVPYVWENLFINRGDFHGFTIRKNKVYRYSTSGIETFGARNVIIEYNEIYDPLDFDRGGRGIKAGGASLTTSGDRFYSDNIIVRYNKVYNIIQGASKPEKLTAVDGTNTKSGKIYGNLIYNVRGHGIKIPGELNEQGWEVYNNTVLDCDLDAIQIYTNGKHAANVRINNNILQGDKHDINCIVKGTSEKVSGANNLLLTGTVGGSYQGQNDIKSAPSKLFVNSSQHNYHLAPGAVAIDAGVSVDSYTHDLDGNRIIGRPDLGAYEYTDGQIVPTPAPAPAPAPPAPSPSPSPGDEGDQGKVNYRYYEGSWSSLPDFDQQKVVKQGTVSNFDLGVRQRDYDFGIVYDGSIDIATAGTYTFYTASDDGTKLYINGKQIVNNDGLHSKQEKSGTITLTKGKHNIELQYFERSGKEILEVWYAGPGISKKRIPSSVLSPEKKNNPPVNQPIAPEAPSASADAWLESECANSIGNVWQLINDGKASGGSYLSVKSGNISPSSAPTGSDDAVVFNFSVSQAGQYKIFTRHWAQNEGDDSFWIQINDGSWIAAHVGANRGAFVWAQLKSTTYALKKGNNQIKVAFREPNARLDKIYVTLTGGAPSDKGGSATNCSASPAPVSPPSAPTNGTVSVNIQDETVTLPQKQVTLGGSGNGPNPFRAYQWEQLSGPSVRMEDQNTANAQLYDLQVGTYMFRFTATDSEGNSGSGDMTLTVNNGSNARLAQQQKKTTMTVSPSEATIVQDMIVYPNPVRDNKVFIQLPDTVQEAEIQIYGYDGRLLRTVRKMAAQGMIELGKSILPAEGNTFLLSVKTLHQRQVFRIFRD